MNKEQFTPGKWLLDGSVIDTHDSFEICTVSTDSDDRDGNIISETEWKANANLIAAAPNMYEALKSLWIDLRGIRSQVSDPLAGEIGDAMSEIEKVLAKANP